MMQITIANRAIGASSPTFVVAEIGLNHNGDVSAAERLVREAAACGADAVKFQTYVAEKRIARSHPLFELLKQCELDERAHAHLKSIAEHLGVVFFSTPFDLESAALLQALDVPAFKIASFDICHYSLLRAVASTGKPVVLSRGAADEHEIDAAVDIFKAAGSPYALLHCVSAYPTELGDANLRAIETLAQTYHCVVGYSDHTLGSTAAPWAVALGARIIEKHFTLDKTLSGPDQAMSADPREFRDLVGAVRTLERALGDGMLGPRDVEVGILQFRRQSS